MNLSHERKVNASGDIGRGISPIDANGDSNPHCCHATSHKHRRASKKRVRWDRVHKREYSLIVGDHPLCQDGLPVSFGWQYSDCCPDSLVEASERKQSYAFPRRLSYDERRERLFSGGLSAEQVKSDEIDLIVRTLSECWDSEGMDCMGLIDPLADIDMLADDEAPMDMDIDLGDISNFEWTD